MMNTHKDTKQIWGIRKTNMGACSKLLAVAGAFTVIGLGTGAVIHADEVETTPTPLEESEILPTDDTAIDNETTADDATTDKTAETETVDTGIPQSVDNVTQDEAVSTIDDAQETLANEADEAEKSGVIVNHEDTETVTINDQNATDKTNEMLKELNDAAQTVIEAKDAMDIIHADQQALQESKDNMEKVRSDALAFIEETKDKADELQTKINITDLPDKDYTPEYVSLEGLTGQELRDAIRQNQEAYSKAVAQAIADQDKLTADLRSQLDAYKQILSEYETTVAANEQELQESKDNMEAVRSDALAFVEATKDKAEDLQAKITITDLPDKDYTPEYVSLEGLTGQALLDAYHKNQEAYNAAVAQAITDQDKLTADLRSQLDAYKQALADYESGVSSQKSGIQWASNTTVVAGTAQKMTGNENVVDFASGSLKDAARYAIQSNALNQNTDANFNNIFKINGSGSIVIRNTTNGDVTLTFSNINAPGNTGTYVAIWGQTDGAIAWGVFATYSGSGSSSGSGEGGSGSSGSWTGTGRILDYVYSYDFKVETTGEVATFTFNDIDNNQTISNVDGINASAAKIEVGKNITTSGGKYSAGRGDVSQASGNILDSNSVRWSWNSSAARTFVGSHSTSAKNSSIVAGIFGEDSMIAIVPEAIEMNIQKGVVTPMETGDIELVFEKGVVTAPEIEVSIPKYEVVKTPETPVTPETPSNDQGVNTAANLDLFMAEMMAGLAALGGVLVGTQMKKRKAKEQ